MPGQAKTFPSPRYDKGHFGYCCTWKITAKKTSFQSSRTRCCHVDISKHLRFNFNGLNCEILYYQQNVKKDEITCGLNIYIYSITCVIYAETFSLNYIILNYSIFFQACTNNVCRYVPQCAVWVQMTSFISTKKKRLLFI